MNINKLPTGFRFELPANGGVWGTRALVMLIGAY